MNSCLLNELEQSFEWRRISGIMENISNQFFFETLANSALNILVSFSDKACYEAPSLIGRDVQSHDLIGCETILNIKNRKSAIQKCICIYPDMRN